MVLPTRYNPKQVEDKLYNFWVKNNFFSASSSSKKPPFCIVIPPPNITGILHMGHALNNTIQDILIRFKRMQGYNALWIPGIDHAGIATQNVIEKELAEEGLKKEDLGREEFLRRIWQWKKKYGLTIINQLKRLGSSCDWERLRFTMDEGYTKAVQKVFVDLYNKKKSIRGKRVRYIYRGSYIIKLCPRCQTALSDEESPYKEIKGKLYYIKYPLKAEYRKQRTEYRKTKNLKPGAWSLKPDYVVVATTRPETMLGDTAVAVNPGDKRYKKIIGCSIILPLVGREIKIIQDDLVDPEFGTGCVKVTPAHDPNDYDIGKRHNLETILVMNPDGIMNKNAHRYEGMDRFQARRAIIDDLEAEGLLLKVTPYTHSVGHCYRCNTIIEPYLSMQWFVRMKLLSKKAIEVVEKGKLKFHPPRWKKVYLNWMYNIHDWCISRQIWWGHRIPVYYCRRCQKTEMQNLKIEAGLIISKEEPEKCPFCGGGDIVQDKDVLDTWFSSWLWPFVTMGWPEDIGQKTGARGQKLKKRISDLGYFYPTSILVTAQEIIFFWVARMIIASLEFTKKVPFYDVYIHGTVRDETGTKMSKSLGNIINPLDIINKFGADSLRFSIISITAKGQDVYLSEGKFLMGRNFTNKIWNASRFIMRTCESLGNIPIKKIKDIKGELSIADRWILSRLNKVIEATTRNLNRYRLNESCNIIYEFFWQNFCDWYLEIAKLNLTTKYSLGTKITLVYVLEKFLRLIHPFMPFISEEIWQNLKELPVTESIKSLNNKSIMIADWPKAEHGLRNKELERDFDFFSQVVSMIRNIRSQMDITFSKKLEVRIICKSDVKKKAVLKYRDYIIFLCNLSKLELLKHGVKNRKKMLVAVGEGLEILIPVEGVIDIKAHINRLRNKIATIDLQLESINSKLSNKNFITNAPSEIINKEKEKKKRLTFEKSVLEVSLKAVI